MNGIDEDQKANLAQNTRSDSPGTPSQTKFAILYVHEEPPLSTGTCMYQPQSKTYLVRIYVRYVPIMYGIQLPLSMNCRDFTSPSTSEHCLFPIPFTLSLLIKSDHVIVPLVDASYHNVIFVIYNVLQTTRRDLDCILCMHTGRVLAPRGTWHTRAD